MIATAHCSGLENVPRCPAAALQPAPERTGDVHMVAVGAGDAVGAELGAGSASVGAEVGAAGDGSQAAAS